jgi:class 3 adenylate cyclase/uncharacterized caspase-like protein
MGSQRRALLIGVAEHDVVGPNLPAVRNDLRIMEEALQPSHYAVEQLGMKKTEAPTRSTILRRIRGFFASAEEGSTSLLYFSGHGVHYNNRDYVIPSDATLDDPAIVEDYLVPVDLTYVIGECKAQTIIFFVDACRDGIEIADASKKLSKGLRFDVWSEEKTRLIGERESAIVFSCGPGALSWCAEGNEYSLFTKALADVLNAAYPARTFRDVIGELESHVNELTKQHNHPDQALKICAEFDPRFRLLDREICDGPKPDKADLSAPSGVGQTHQSVVVGPSPPQASDYRDKSVHACVLFADLFGSIEFRVNHSEHETVSKMLLHNTLAGDTITSNAGVVVKHVSDRVMGVFAGNRCEEQAVSTGIAIIRRLEEENGRRNLHFPHDLNSTIGIKSGDIWKFHFNGCNVEDYMGDAVDVADRLCSLAALGQLMCDEDTFQKIRFRHADWGYSDQFERFVEGLDEPLLVRLIVPVGRSTGEDLIRLRGFTRRVRDGVRDAVKDKVKRVQQLFRGKRFDEALQLCGEILGVDRGNFEANVCCAEILLDRATAGSSIARLNLQEVIRQYLCVAKQICPQANCVWRLLGWAYYLQAAHADRDADKVSLLDTAFKRAEKALGYAQDYMDESGETRAKTLLVMILREQARLTESRRAEYLARANEYCGETGGQLIGFLDRTRSDHFLAQAVIQADLGASTEMIEKILNQARDADPRNPRVHKAFEEFCRTGKASAIWLARL